jgi:hypothetical protein
MDIEKLVEKESSRLVVATRERLNFVVTKKEWWMG